MGILEDNIEKVLSQQVEMNDWKGCKYEKINLLKADFSGKVGELWLRDFALSCGLEVFYEENKISKNGGAVYDMIISSKKVEVKTARLSSPCKKFRITSKNCKHKKFQHENIKESGPDILAFVDITPDEAFLTLLNYSGLDITAKLPVFGIKPIDRKNSQDYKIDLTMSKLELGIKNGITVKIDDVEATKKFLLDKISI